VRVGDLVRHKRNGYIGIITKIEYAESYLRLLSYIMWTDGAQGVCWKNEIEIISASR